MQIYATFHSFLVKNTVIFGLYASFCIRYDVSPSAQVPGSAGEGGGLFFFEPPCTIDRALVATTKPLVANIATAKLS